MPLGLAKAVMSRKGGVAGNTGFVLAGTGANINDGGSTSWTSPTNITASDESRAQCLRNTPGTSQLLAATNFDFSGVPAGAAITGVETRIERSFSTAGTATVRDHTLRLTKDGTTMVGTNNADTGTNWPLGSDANADYGSSSDLWGTTLTAAEVKTSTFGVMLKSEHVAVDGVNNANVRVDTIWINIHYLA